MTDNGGTRTCFVVMPITVPSHLLERYGDRPDHFTKIYDALIAPAVERAGLEPIGPARSGTENIQAGIINDLQDADLVLADLSALNPNVFLELGIRSALDKPVCLVWDGHDGLPFDSGTLNTHRYDSRPIYELNTEIRKMAEFIKTTIDKSEGRNALWRFFGSASATLPTAELNPADATVASKLARLTELVESRLATPPPAPAALTYGQTALLKSQLERAFEDAGPEGLHGTRVQRVCEIILADSYPAFVGMGGSLSGRLRTLGFDIRTNNHGQFFLGPEPDPA